MSETHQQTIEVKDKFSIKVKVTEHPNASKYPGRPSFEVLQSKIKFLNELSEDEIDLLADGRLIVEPEMTAQFFDSLLVGDVIGLALMIGINEYNMNPSLDSAAYKFKILSIDRPNDTLHCKNVTWHNPKKKDSEQEYIGAEVDIAFEDVSVALGMGFAEILERDGKPFGMPEEVEQQVVLVGAKSDDPAAAAPAPTTPDANTTSVAPEVK